MLEDVMDDEQCYQAAASKDARFDGVFFIAVTSTGIYCRPSCPAIIPRRENMRFYPSAAAAQQNGFRACKRCRPDATPGSPEWNVRADVTGRAMRLIADGAVDRVGISGLAGRLGYSERQLRRLLTDELGAGPLALARAQRAQTARILVETTTLPMSDVAFAAGFASIRQFNDTMQEVFDSSPTQLRDRAGKTRPGHGSPGQISLRLPYRSPIDLDRMIGFLAARAVPGIEEATDRSYARSIALPHGSGIIRIAYSAKSRGHVDCALTLSDLRDLTTAVRRCRRLLDLDADPEAISGQLALDEVLGPLVNKCPGRRVPGHVDGDELAIRAVLGQQVSIAAARKLAARLVAEHGEPLPHPDGTITHLFPSSAAMAAIDPETLPMPGARARALTGLATALASGAIILDPGAEREEVTSALLELPGIGRWTASYIAMRALADPDAFMPSDIGVRDALRNLGADHSPRGAARLAEAWRPWRSYATQHLWASIETGGTPS
jgi:AraC family transcriptional regulator of adaptative response / DNA-3-methyladenine glycosylase II